nr:hypothetical protein [uncultured bacterium]
MTQYDQQYQVEKQLFGTPYAEFEAFVSQHAQPGGRALDLGCGQGRDALMLARHGYVVTGVDVSQVGIDQMLAAAEADGLAVDGIVADFHAYTPEQRFDAIVLDSVLHFSKTDKHQEWALLDRLVNHLNAHGFLFLFVHRSRQKERDLKRWVERVKEAFRVVEEGYIDYAYQEKVSGFRSEFQYYMLILQRRAPSSGEISDHEAGASAGDEA